MTFGEEISERIHELRESQNLTQEQLAERADIDPSYLGRIERGQNSNLQIKTIDKIITALGIDYAEFFLFKDSSDELQSLMSQISASKHQAKIIKIIKELLEFT
ncbi:helix-turn-helix domain-containing protein [Lapidilactobacillus mulanensis]|uniref:Helix-turn-helix domain-containing protein n=1 Tax=Lapidilactobacillus mulanensis TaxID=2485999 RepID=A0ABW4DQD7_9LACO|nr:helix-turn-helix transcriptional regulator [Lapidilactobacillus mulanensis]